LVAVHEEQVLHIDAHTARTRWRGEPMDYGLAIDALLAKERRARLQRQLDGPSRALRPSIS
jgi:hypothetical protein